MGRLGLRFQDREDGNGAGGGGAYSTRNSIQYPLINHKMEMKKKKGEGALFTFFRLYKREVWKIVVPMFLWSLWICIL